MIRMIWELIIKNRQFIKFGIVGLSNTLISYVTYVVLVYFHTHYQIANISAFVISSLSGFLLNRLWVFQAKSISINKQIIKYYIVYGTSLTLSLFLSYLWIDVFGINIYLSPIINLFLTVPYNYFLNKVWAFKVHKTNILQALQEGTPNGIKDK